MAGWDRGGCFSLLHAVKKAGMPVLAYGNFITVVL
jgi:hypothetical protein